MNAAHDARIRRSNRADVYWCVFAVAFGIFLRGVGAHDRSYWIDEMHSLGHGLRPTVAATADSVQRDFHAPLFYFAVQEFFAHRMGDGPHAPRFLSILANLLTLIPIGLLADRIGGRRCGLLAVGVAALLPFQIHYAIELRPYAPLMFCAALAGWAAFDDRGPTWLRGVVFFAATALGVLTQFLTALVVFCIGFARIVCAIVRRREAADVAAATPPPSRKLLPLWALISAGALGGAALLPWIFTRMRWILEQGATELAPDDAAAPLADLHAGGMLTATLQKPFQIFIPRIDALGEPWNYVMKAAGAVAAAIVVCALLLGILRGLRGRPRAIDADTGGSRVACALILYAIVTWAALSWLQIYSWRRVVLRYDVIEAWIGPIVLAWCFVAADGRFGAFLRRALLVAVAFLGAAETFGPPTEELQRAVRVARETGARLLVENPARPPIYTSLLWQPRFFDSALPFRIYAPDAPFQAPDLLPGPNDPDFGRPVVAVVQQYRALENPAAEFDHDANVEGLRRGRKALRSYRVDDRVRVIVFTPK